MVQLHTIRAHVDGAPPGLSRGLTSISGTFLPWAAYNVARGRISMKRTAIANAAGLLAGLALAAGVVGCRIHVDKDANGHEKNVRVDTPFGGIHVDTDQTTAADLGLPVYPGAQIVTDKDHDKSANIHMGFGEWELRVMVVNYSTTDSQDKVMAFYKQALDRYGDVLTCRDHEAVGTPTTTSEGLTCRDSGGADVQVHDHDNNHGYKSSSVDTELKAGSKRHQHIVGFEDPEQGQTRFSLVVVDLPAGAVGDSDKGKSN